MRRAAACFALALLITVSGGGAAAHADQSLFAYDATRPLALQPGATLSGGGGCGRS